MRIKSIGTSSCQTNTRRCRLSSPQMIYYVFRLRPRITCSVHGQRKSVANRNIAHCIRWVEIFLNSKMYSCRAALAAMDAAMAHSIHSGGRECPGEKDQNSQREAVATFCLVRTFSNRAFHIYCVHNGFNLMGRRSWHVDRDCVVFVFFFPSLVRMLSFQSSSLKVDAIKIINEFDYLASMSSDEFTFLFACNPRGGYAKWTRKPSTLTSKSKNDSDAKWSNFRNLPIFLFTQLCISGPDECRTESIFGKCSWIYRIMRNLLPLTFTLK